MKKRCSKELEEIKEGKMKKRFSKDLGVGDVKSSPLGPLFGGKKGTDIKK